MPVTRIAPDLQSSWDAMTARLPDLQSRNLQVTLVPFSTSTVDGDRGVRLEAVRNSVTYSLSIEVDFDSVNTTTILVDGQLNPIAPTASPKPNDLDARIQKVVAWFVDDYAPA